MENKFKCPICKRQIDSKDKITMSAAVMHKISFYEWKKLELENKLELNYLFEGICPICKSL